ncbi:Biopolymer transport protein ExbD/TolR [Caulifigura coniformis]|uniref:Biopolymer transport protein ExbD/TolR n=1 Tax=Caulifigura coniformis TaxID=2527983 RepID=A0A517SCE0_9PLAN|nr:biopolymer transporter ExbD [Caulifigura coniformis]QDT53775.1 Biopolymer transport protein ExbD/TolR [Caulifigura coniformis]
MAKRAKKHRSSEEVQLNLAAMLDMAFQLLAFFILTFRPSPVEGQLLLNLPPPTPVTKVSSAGGEGPAVPASDVEPVLLSVMSDPAGKVAGVTAFSGDTGFRGPADAANLQRLNQILKDAISVDGSLYDQILIQVDPTLHYDELMKIIDVCLKQTLPDGTPLTKINFTELPVSEPM